ncbi:MAG TPA: hypothetical protein VHI93_07090 [Candidatus Thermoplasmatota archaeon]|nr:hypothetical protein [Candidatus Thermoplasmatota archaeon]
MGTTAAAVAGGGAGLGLAMAAGLASGMDLASPAAVGVAAFGSAAALRRWERPRVALLAMAGTCCALAGAMLGFLGGLLLSLPLAYALPFLKVPPQLRLAGGGPVGLLVALVAGSLPVASLSGPFLAVGVAGYGMAWGWRETAPWARRTAWGLTAAWALLAVAVSAASLAEIADGVAVGTVALSPALLAGAAFALLREACAPLRQPRAGA